jgi:phage shock protein E
MGLLDFMKRPDIDQGVKDYNDTEGAVLLDVRSPQEYAGGHIPDSKNVPLQSIANAGSVVKDKNTPLFVYCYSGARSAQAVSALKQMGYANVTNIGGIASYSGKVKR